MTRLLPLRVTVPLSILICAAAAAAFTVWFALRLTRSSVYDTARGTSAARMSQQQYVLETAVRRGDIPFVEELVTGLASDRSVRSAVLFGGDDRVVASSRREQIGLAAPSLPAAGSLLAEARATPGPVLVTDERHGRVWAAIALDTAESTLSQGTSGVLVVEHDVSRELARGERDAGRAGGVFLVILAGASLGAGALFERLITRRATAVQSAAAAIAAGRLDARTGIDGADEIGGIGRAVDAMAASLEERRRENTASEERYRALFDAGNAIFVARPDGRYEEGNAAALALCGYTQEELRRMTLREMLAPQDAVLLDGRLEHLRRVGGTTVCRTLVARSGERIPVELAARVLPDGRMVGVARDLRPQREAERLREQLAQHERLAGLGTLAASVGHEINNPLTFVQGNLATAAELVAQLPASSRGDLPLLLADARDGAERVRRIVADLRIFSRSQPEDAMGAVNLSHLLRSTVHLAGPAIRDRARVVIDVAHGLPPVRGEERRLGQVLLNLIGNASDAMPRGRPAERNVIRLRARQDDGHVVLEVKDNGQGIAPEHIPHVFDPFFTTKPPGEGTGLGLSISREILTRAGATIEVESTPDIGTTFLLRFATEAPPPDTRSDARMNTPQAHGTPLQVLVIDDEPLLARVLTRMMKDHVVTTAGGPAEALRRFPEATFDRIFCDLSMPGGGGKAFYDGLAAVRPDLLDRVVFMTGGAASVEASAFLDATRRPVLEKPIDPLRLRALLQDPSAR